MVWKGQRNQQSFHCNPTRFHLRQKMMRQMEKIGKNWADKIYEGNQSGAKLLSDL